MCNKKTQGRSQCFVIYICKFVFLCCILSDLPQSSNGITTTYYSKPSNSKSYREEYKLQNANIKFPNISVSERQKRLLPYINHYVTQPTYQVEPYPNNQQYNIAPPRKTIPQQSFPIKFNELIGMAYESESYNNYNTQQQQPLQPSNIKFTPFSSNNALPGAFLPMVKPQPENIEVSYVPFEQSKKIPNYSAIYDKLSQLKLRQNAFLEQNPRHQNHRYVFNRKPQVNYIPEQLNYVPVSSIKPQVNYIPEQINFVPVSTSKPYTGTYNTVLVDVPIKQNIRYEIKNYDELPEPISITENPLRIAEFNNPNLQPIAQPLYQQIPKPHIKFRPQPNYIRVLTKNPQTHYVLQNPKQYHTQSHRQYLQEVTPSTIKPIVLAPQNQIQYEPKPVPNPIMFLEPTLQPVVTHNGQNYEPIPNPTIQQMPTIITTTPIIPTENPNSLSLILQKLQDSNTLPHTLTPENIDNSIKTLVRILSSLKSQKKVIEPIVVAEEGDYVAEQENETNNEEEEEGQLKQIFPAENLEGGTPGKPGIDYPALSTIPHTSFNCTTQRYKGFFADPETNCQVWHYCDLNGGQASFLCPNGTIFSQVALTCDWWYNVKCSTTTQLYVLNERLYKYIIPLTPKFPEDYAGPLVDKYLALKFKEMEEKMKEKAEKESNDDKTEEIDELQLLEDKNNESSTSGTKK